MGPEVGMGMDDGAIGNLKDLGHGDGQEGEGPEVCVFLEVVVGTSANQNGASLEAGEALEGGGPVVLGVTPFSVPIKMIMGDHSLPKVGDFIVRQANISAGYGTA
jgi:hypothetical protein